jgi:competence protein ComEA
MYSKNALNNFLNDTLNQNSSIDKSDSILISKMKSLEDSVKSKDDLQQKKGKEKYLKEKSININTAGKDELVKLPGVGEAMADKIIKYRDVHMGFKKIDDIKKVKGIGKKKFEKMKPYITVE